MATAWIESLEISEKPTADDVRSFFGVPPDPPERLDSNISRKRRQWSGKVRGRKASPEAEAKVKQALELIKFLADYLKRGVDEPLDLADLKEAFRHAPRTSVGDIDELWSVVEELLASGELDEALKVAYDARTRFPDEAVGHAVFGWVAAQASRGLDQPSERLRTDGLAAIERAIAAGQRDADLFGARAVLQLDLRRGAEALAGLQQAELELADGLPPLLGAYAVEAHVAVGDVDGAARHAIAAVEADPGNLAIRSGIALSLVYAMRNTLLPISSRESLAHYQMIAEIAAWCATGAPEAEDIVRPFRMWSVMADNRMYSGDIGFRAFAAVLTGFLLLPLINRVRSKAQWRIMHDGPSSVGPEVFRAVALGAVARFVHAGCVDRLPWWTEYVATAGSADESSEGGR
jgi:tetratricopeptide (TPR) repeat protein